MYTQGSQIISMALIEPTHKPLRKEYQQERIKELANSLGTDGLIQPVIVRPISGKQTKFQIVVGSRRFMAAQYAGLKEIPAIVTELDELGCYEIALVENLQREDLTIFEEAVAFFNLMKTKGYDTVEKLSKRLGKEPTYIRNRLKVLQLPAQVQNHVAKGKISLRQATLISGISEDHQQVEVADLIANKNLTNDEAEALTRKHTGSYHRILKVRACTSPVEFFGRLDALTAGLTNADWSNVNEQSRTECVEFCQSLGKNLQVLAREIKNAPEHTVITDRLRSVRKEVRGVYKAVELITLIKEAERRVRALVLKSHAPEYHHAIIASIRALSRVTTNRDLEFRQRTVATKRKNKK